MSETLKAWCHWKRKEKDVSEDDLEMVKEIEDTVSQVNNWKAKYEQACEKLNLAEEALEAMAEWVPYIRGWNPVSKALALRDKALTTIRGQQ